MPNPNSLKTLFHGPNAGYVLDRYDRFLDDPASVDAETRALFARWQPDAAMLDNGSGPAAGDGQIDTEKIDTVVGAVNLAQALREYGHLAAAIDPLGRPAPGDPSLDLAFHGLREENLYQLPAFLVGGPCGENCENAHQALADLRRIYTGSTGFDYDHLRIPAEREWLRDAAETGRFRPPAAPINATALLERLTQVEVFEHFLHRTFPGKTRFSIEGLDVMVPMLDELVGAAVEQEISSLLIGMAHRGRLNVLAHVLNKPYAQMLAEFKDPLDPGTFNVRDYLGYTGDVKYHAGACRIVSADTDMDADGEMTRVAVDLAPNPSHLEHVNPVVEGMARAAGTFVDAAGPPRFDHIVSLPVLIHGDAAFPGQGVVAETLNLSQLEGYHTGGTIHIIANNQLGFTTDPEDVHSTLYASDLAKGFKIPIVHVNADDPVACLEAARLAAAYRHTFQKDFLIDLVGYRRYGHNEGDEPRFTQPRMYKIIDEHPTVRELWAGRLQEAGELDEEKSQAIYDEQMAELQTLYDGLQPEEELPEPALTPPPPGAAKQIDTSLPLEKLDELQAALLKAPDGFTIHARLQRVFARRVDAFADPDAPNVDWSHAEQLALASILAAGIAVRLSGEDAERGTFSHRHAVLHDPESGAICIPLQAFPQAQAAFEIVNSPLTEAATIGFEYGYNIQAPERLVIWEAQYGDFINVAQAMLDEFVTSGRAKWEQTPSLVLLLPHGYEGAGPDHSTARLERFLQAAAETNLRVAYPTTAAQYFHLLRRQALLLRTDPLPLVVMTPKSLLRHRLSASTPNELAEGRWQPVLDDPNAEPEQVKRLILCSGKIAIDLLENLPDNRPPLAIVRVEQLYPFPTTQVENILARYQSAAEVVWVQEEPANMGAWDFVYPHLHNLLQHRVPLRYVGRPDRASPAEGSSAWHAVNQKALIEAALAVV
ncbi:MAG: 2-oxoglutarate dehydrogenase E1 component [Caldilineaceae bacterium]|nr:2-oxoglutarate dehydrogenase E1 component [Caldilineaceae bacterium]